MTFDVDDGRLSNSKRLDKVRDAGRQVLDVLDSRREQAGEQFVKLRSRAGSAALQARDHAGQYGRRGLTTVKRKPVSTGVAAIGAGIGLFLLLNPKTRSAATSVALRIWDEIKARR
jgi:hypothetical protein